LEAGWSKTCRDKRQLGKSLRGEPKVKLGNHLFEETWWGIVPYAAVAAKRGKPKMKSFKRTSSSGKHVEVPRWQW
jgi:hypothetical protein